MKYLAFLLMAFTCHTSDGQVYEPHEVNQDLIDRVEACVEKDNLYKLPSIKMVQDPEDIENEAIRDLFPWKPRPILPRPPREEKPAEPPTPAPEPPKEISPPRKPILPPMPWNPEKPKTPSPEKEVQGAGIIGKIVAWLKANFPILGGSVSFLVNLSVVLLFLYVFYIVSEFAKATTNQKNWVAKILREPFVQLKGLIDSFRKKQ